MCAKIEKKYPSKKFNGKEVTIEMIMLKEEPECIFKKQIIKKAKLEHGLER